MADDVNRGDPGAGPQLPGHLLDGVATGIEHHDAQVAATLLGTGPDHLDELIGIVDGSVNENHLQPPGGTRHDLRCG